MDRSSSPTHRRFKPEPIETSTKKSRRRFAPEPIETTVRSSKNADQAEDASPQSTTRSKPETGDLHDLHKMSPPRYPPKKEQSPKPARRKFAVEPVETTTRHRRQDKDTVEEIDEQGGRKSPTSHEQPSSQVKKPRRKFAPQLIETVSRSRKATDLEPGVRLSDRTNVSPSDVVESRSSRPRSRASQTDDTTGASEDDSQLLKPAPHRQGSIHVQYNTRANTRSPSYKVPSLDKIESSESEGSDKSESPPASEDTEHSRDDPTRMRESQDDQFTGYLLNLAAKAAEKQLREQALAAFPNTDEHQPVAHYVDGSEDDEADRMSRIRSESGDERRALLEMQNWAAQKRKTQQQDHHQQQPKQQAKGNEPRKTGGFNVEFDGEPTNQDAWLSNLGASYPDPGSAPKKVIGGKQNPEDIRHMRKAASPPMLGGSIDFPRCPSPDHARFDITQDPRVLKDVIVDQEVQTPSTESKGLWGGGGRSRPATPQPEENPASPGGMWGGNSNAGAGPGGGVGGLWGGFCTDKDGHNLPTPTGLVTPQRTPYLERDDPFENIGSRLASYDDNAKQPLSINTQFPPSPPASSQGSTVNVRALNSVSSKLELEQRVAQEFDDIFVTQVFNYLSLGYPSLARKFDEELSKISGVPLEDLQLDDSLAEFRGYVRVGGEDEDEELSKRGAGVADGEGVVRKDQVRRWGALKRYVREWGRQMVTKEIESGGKTADPHRAWGLPARRGSWGI